MLQRIREGSLGSHEWACEPLISAEFVSEGDLNRWPISSGGSPEPWLSV